MAKTKSKDTEMESIDVSEKKSDKSFTKGKKFKGKSDKFKKPDKKDSGKSGLHYHGTNDITHFNKNKILLEQVASLPTTGRVGYTYPVEVSTATVGGYSSSFHSGCYTPSKVGVLIASYMPGIGKSGTSNADNAINLAAAKEYTTVTSGNSRSVSYNAAAQQLYLLSIENAYAFVSYLWSLYGRMRYFSANTMFTPAPIISALGFDYNDIKMHLNDLLAYSNQLALTFSTWFMPTDHDYLSRMMWMTTGFFCDDETNMEQIIMFKPEGFFFYDDSVTPAQLNFNPFPATTPATFADIVAYGDSLVATFMNNDDFNLISADFKKYYGANAGWVLGQLDTTYVVIPKYEQEVLMELENAVTRPWAGSLFPVPTIKEDTNGYLYMDDMWFLPLAVNDTNNNLYYLKKHSTLLNFHKSEVSPEDIVIATRMITMYDVPSAQQGAVELTKYGTEIVTGFTLIVNERNLTTDVVSTTTYSGIQTDMIVDEAYYTPTESRFREVSLMSNFDWHPILNTYTTVVTTPGVIRRMYKYGDLSVTVELTADRLSRITDVANLSLFGIHI